MNIQKNSAPTDEAVKGAQQISTSKQDNTKSITRQELSAIALKVSSSVNKLEQAENLLKVLNESFNDSFNFKPENSFDEIILETAKLLISSFSILEDNTADTLNKLQAECNKLNNMVVTHL